MKLFGLAECALALGLVACGGSSSSGSSNPDGGSGGAGAGGSGGSGPAAQAAAYVHIMAADAAETPAGKSCNVQAHNATIGDPPSTTTKGLPVVDGEGGVVTCSVTGSG